MSLRQMQTADLEVNKVNIVVKCSTRLPFRKTNLVEDLGIGNLFLPASLQVYSLCLSCTDEFVGPTNTEPFGLQITSSNFRMNFKQCTLFECQCIKPEITNISYSYWRKRPTILPGHLSYAKDWLFAKQR